LIIGQAVGECQAAGVRRADNREQSLADQRAKLAQVQAQLKTVSGNMALAKRPDQFEAMSSMFDTLKTQETSLKAQIAEMDCQLGQVRDAEAEVAAAMGIVQRLTELVSDSDGLNLADEAFWLTGARLFLRFQPVQVKRRLLNKVAEAVVVLGSVPDPIEIYRGPTGRRALNYNGSVPVAMAEPGKLSLNSPPEYTISSGSEGNSLRNVSRGDWI
jgi:hypothetical protein